MEEEMKSIRSSKKVFMILWVIGALFFSSFEMTDGAELQKVKAAIGTQILVPVIANLWIGRYLGYYEEEGIDAVWLTSGGTAQVAQWLATGQIELGTIMPDPILFQAAKGEEIGATVVYNMNRKTMYYIVAKPESGISSLKDLKGKKIGVFSLGHAVLQFAKFAVREIGLDPEKDVSYLAIGQGVQAAKALYDGHVDALSTWDSEITTMEDIGYKLTWLPLPPMAGELFGAQILERNSFLKSNPALSAGFLRAIAKGTVFTVENPKAAIQIHYKLYPESLPKGKPMDQVMKEMIRGVAMRAQRCFAVRPDDQDRRWGASTRKGWDIYLKFLGLEGKIKDPYKYYTNELIDDVNRFDVERIRTQARNFNFEEYEKKKGK